MAGTMNTNAGGVGGATTPRRYQPKEAQAFCEGMKFRLSGTAAARPKNQNPYTSIPQADLKAAWDNGWDSAHANAGGALVPYNCALRGTVSA